MTDDLTAADLGLPGEGASELSVEHARRLAATLDERVHLVPGAPLPLLWHWAWFTPSVPTADLGVDGHPALADGGPTAGMPRRMWAGGRVRSLEPLVLGTPAARRSIVVRAERKTGRSGELLVVTVAHEVEQQGRVVLVEEQDLVYRAASPDPVPAPIGDERPAASTSGWCEDVLLGPPALFRYSALTFNSHRIHYDHAYAVADEGYPGLVVQGPLTATLLAGSARRHGHVGTTFTFRASAPLFADLPFTIQGEPGGGGVDLYAVRNDGVIAVSARLA